MTERAFCVYVHRNAATGQPFYVGKGYLPRSRSHHGRNRHWHSVVAKHGFDVHIVRCGLPEQCAFSLERALIAAHGRATLANLTDGGEGAKGVKRTPEQVAAMTERKIGTRHTKESIELMRASKIGMYAGARNPFYGKTHSDEARAKISAAGVGRVYSAETIARRLAKTAGTQHYKFNDTVRRFQHPEHGSVECTTFDLIKNFGLHHSHMYDVVKGKLRHHKGWTVA
jgi:hypothetical protein